MRGVLRGLSTVLIMSGLLLIADAGVTLALEEPVTAVLGRFKQDTLRGNLRSLERGQPTAVELQAHSAPLGAAFYTGSLLPARYRGGLFVAYHGSTYRTQLTGYKVPKIVEFWKELPKTNVGKVLRREVKNAPVRA